MSEKTNEVVVIKQQTGLNFFDPAQFDTVQRVCKVFSASDLVPDNYRESQKVSKEKAIANCMVALEVANRIGASPLMVMQNLAVISGRPSWSAQFLIATVNTCGRFEPLQFHIERRANLGTFTYTVYEKKWIQPDNGGKGHYETVPVEKTYDGKKAPDIECYAFTWPKGHANAPDYELRGDTISIKMAILEGWYDRNGSKWQTMPQQMLRYRAAAFWTRAYAPELSLGMRTVEENIDMAGVDDQGTPATFEEEKAEKANKEVITIDPAKAESDKTVITTIDHETGEVIEQKYGDPAPDKAEAAKAAPKQPADPDYEPFLPPERGTTPRMPGF